MLADGEPAPEFFSQYRDHLGFAVGLSEMQPQGGTEFLLSTGERRTLIGISGPSLSAYRDGVLWVATPDGVIRSDDQGQALFPYSWVLGEGVTENITQAAIAEDGEVWFAGTSSICRARGEEVLCRATSGPVYYESLAITRDYVVWPDEHTDATLLWHARETFFSNEAPAPAQYQTQAPSIERLRVVPGSPNQVLFHTGRLAYVASSDGEVSQVLHPAVSQNADEIYLDVVPKGPDDFDVVTTALHFAAPLLCFSSCKSVDKRQIDYYIMRNGGTARIGWAEDKKFGYAELMVVENSLEIWAGSERFKAPPLENE